MAVDSDGHPHVAYFDPVLGGVAYARKAAGVWEKTLVAASSPAYETVTVALDQERRPHVCFSTGFGTESQLWWARKAGSDWAIECIDDSLGYDLRHSMVLDSEDRPRLAYRDWVRGGVRYARGSFEVRPESESKTFDGPIAPLASVDQPQRVRLWPNPLLSGQSRLYFELAREAVVESFTVYDVSGRLVRALTFSTESATRISAVWDRLDSSGRQVAPGTYFLRLTSDNGADVTERVTIVR